MIKGSVGLIWILVQGHTNHLGMIKCLWMYMCADFNSFCIRYHNKAVRQVSFHKRYPLFASSSDDGTIQIFYGMVYNDLLQNPLIVPVKILRGHETKDGLGVLNIEFHPTQPWIFSTGSDGTLRLWT